MTEFNKGDRVAHLRSGTKGVVQTVGATCLYLEDGTHGPAESYIFDPAFVFAVGDFVRCTDAKPHSIHGATLTYGSTYEVTKAAFGSLVLKGMERVCWREGRFEKAASPLHQDSAVSNDDLLKRIEDLERNVRGLASVGRISHQRLCDLETPAPWSNVLQRFRTVVFG